jgi:hypothetical protein
VNSLSEINDFGISFSRPQNEQVKLPEDITLLSSEQLAEKFSQLTAWADYIASQLTFAQLEERGAQRASDLVENRLLVSRMGTAARGERVTYVKAQISLEPEVIEAQNKYEEKYAYRKLVEMMLSNHERDLTLVSREITRRTHDQRAFRKDYGV